MKVSKNVLAMILVVITACVLVIAAIQFVHNPVVQNDWNGPSTINTTTPTLTLFPAQGWWTSMPTDPGVKGVPTLRSPNPTRTPVPTWTTVPHSSPTP